MHTCSSYVQQILEESADSSLFPVISRERLSGHTHRGGYDSKEIADRLASVFEHPKILIVIREQVSMILSTYNEYVQNGGTLSLQRYMVHRVQAPYSHDFEFIRFQYHRLIVYYRELFGSKNILVLPYEQFRIDPHLFFKAIAALCNRTITQEQIDLLPFHSAEKQSWSQPSVQLMYRINRFVCAEGPLNSRPIFLVNRAYYKNGVQKPVRMLANKIPRSFHEKGVANAIELISEQVGDFYRESNITTAELTGLDLRHFGYAT